MQRREKARRTIEKLMESARKSRKRVGKLAKTMENG
jgi:hypothetical protein